MTRLLEQKRAAFALRFVLRFVEEEGHRNQAEQQKMATHIQKTPVRILNNGLGQALAFLLADNEGKRGGERKPSGRLYDKLEEWLCGDPDDERPMRVYKSPGQPNLVKQLMEGSREQYLLAQEEALRLFVWLRKFAEAYLEAGDSR